MKELNNKDIELLENKKQYFIIYDEYYRINFKFYYIYQGDSREAIFINNKFLMYLDLDEEIEYIKTKDDEKIVIKNLIRSYMEEVDFMYELMEVVNRE